MVIGSDTFFQIILTGRPPNLESSKLFQTALSFGYLVANFMPKVLASLFEPITNPLHFSNVFPVFGRLHESELHPLASFPDPPRKCQRGLTLPYQ